MKLKHTSPFGDVCLSGKVLKNKKNTFNTCFKHCKLALYYSFVFGFFANIMMLAIPLYSLQVLDRVVSSGSRTTLMMLTIVTILAIALFAMMQWLRSRLMTKLGIWLVHQLGPYLWDAALAVAVKERAYQPRELVNDFQQVKQCLTGPSVNALLDSPWTILFVIALWFIHPLLSGLAILGVLILVFLAIANEYHTKPSLDEANQLNFAATQDSQVAMQHAETIKAMSMQASARGRWWEKATKTLDLQKQASDSNATIMSTTRFIRLVLQISVTCCGAYLVLEQQITVGAMIAAGILVGRALAPFENAIGSWKTVSVAKKAWARLQQRLAVIEDDESQLTLPAPKGQLTVDNLVYKVKAKETPILQNISLKLDPGELCAVIGPSAAGKSTLAKLLLGVLQPSYGHVRLDGAEVYQWSLAALGQHLGYLPQDIALFDGTVKDNIARLDPNANDEVIIQAAQAAQVHDLILHLDQGYETSVNGALSQGQRQRIALARAFYGDPKLLVLDEPNANLDHAGEQALAAALTACRGKTTTVIISHRPSILQIVDKILVLQAGNVAAFGKRNEILERLQQPKLLEEEIC